MAGVQSVIGASVLLGVAGVGATLVTRRSDIERASAAYFWMMGALGLAAAGVVYSCAGWLTGLLGLPEAAGYLQLLAFILPLSFLTMVPVALLLRLRRFSAHRTVALVGSFSDSTIEVALVLRGWGAWSVVIGQVVGAAASLLTALALAKWLPRYGPSIRVIRSDMATLVARPNQLFTYLHKNMDYWTVARVLGSAPLGAYYISYVLPNIVRLRLSDMFRQVMLPVFSSAGGLRDPAAAYSRAFGMFMLLSVPVLVGLLALAGPIVGVFFGSQWSDAVTPMRIILLATIVDLIIQASGTFAIARRRVRNVAWASGLRALLLVGLLATLVPVGPSTALIATCVLVAAVGSLTFQEITVASPLGIGIRRHLRSLTSVLIPATLMGLGVYLLTRGSGTNAR